MDAQAGEYPFSGYRAYLGLEPARLLDVDSVLRPFGQLKAEARERFAAFVDVPAHDSDRDEAIDAML